MEKQTRGVFIASVYLGSANPGTRDNKELLLSSRAFPPALGRFCLFVLFCYFSLFVFSLRPLILRSSHLKTTQ